MRRPILQDPTTCQDTHPDHHHVPLPPHPEGASQPVLVRDDQVGANNRCSTLEHPPPDIRRWRGHCATAPPNGLGELLLRKEVIQPHLPVRLPCYDLVPIASPTFDGSPHKGWATGFGCYRLS